MDANRAMLGDTLSTGNITMTSGADLFKREINPNSSAVVFVEKIVDISGKLRKLRVCALLHPNLHNKIMGFRFYIFLSYFCAYIWTIIYLFLAHAHVNRHNSTQTPLNYTGFPCRGIAEHEDFENALLHGVFDCNSHVAGI